MSRLQPGTPKTKVLGANRIRATLLPVLAGIVVLLTFASSGVAPTIAKTVTIGGPFTLTAADGTTVTDATYRGKWLLVVFGYTRCPDVCPTTLLSIAGTLDSLGDDAENVQPIFITVDPERDTPEVMGQYAAAFHPRIAALTGTVRQIAAVADAYGAYGEPHKHHAADHGYRVDHTTNLYVMDPRGRFVRGLDSGTPSERIVEILREIMARS